MSKFRGVNFYTIAIVIDRNTMCSENSYLGLRLHRTRISVNLKQSNLLRDNACSAYTIHISIFITTVCIHHHTNTSMCDYLFRIRIYNSIGACGGRFERFFLYLL